MVHKLMSSVFFNHVCTGPSSCVEYDVRLYHNDGFPVEGLLQMCIAGKWHTVCFEEQVGYQESDVACRQLGFTGKRLSSVCVNFYG